jgi:hypothetical protein
MRCNQIGRPQLLEWPHNCFWLYSFSFVAPACPSEFRPSIASKRHVCLHIWNLTHIKDETRMGRKKKGVVLRHVNILYTYVKTVRRWRLSSLTYKGKINVSTIHFPCKNRSPARLVGPAHQVFDAMCKQNLCYGYSFYQAVAIYNWKWFSWYINSGNISFFYAGNISLKAMVKVVN